MTDVDCLQNVTRLDGKQYINAFIMSRYKFLSRYTDYLRVIFILYLKIKNTHIGEYTHMCTLSPSHTHTHTLK